MEVTLLIQAIEDSFRIVEESRKNAEELLRTGCRVTAEVRNVEENKIRAFLTGAHQSKVKIQNFVVTFLIMMVFWALLSGKFDLFHLSLGVICSGVVAYFGHSLIFHNVRVGDTRLIAWRFVKYVPWLLYQIILSNFHVAYLALSPKMPINPSIIELPSKLESDISYVTLANSITLTPGTITMDIDDNNFIVHALSDKVADDLKSGDMEDRVAHIYMEADHLYVQDVLDMSQIFSNIAR